MKQVSINYKGVQNYKGSKRDLLQAANDGNYDEIKKLVDQKVDLNVQDNENEDTPLHILVRKQWSSANNLYANCVNVLLDNNADPNIINKQGLTPIELADSLVIIFL